MEIIVNSQLLAQELRLLNKVVAVKPALPTLAYILFHAEPMDTRVSMRATDLELGLTTSCAAVVAVPGSLTLQAKTLASLVEQFPDTDVRIVQEKNHVNISAGAFKSRLQSLPPDDFPPAPEVPEAKTTIGVQSVSRLIGRTRYAIPDKVTKHTMNGALLTLDGLAAMVTTDAKRLAVATTAYEGEKLEIVIPAKALEMLEALEGDEIKIAQNANHLFFTIGDRTLNTRAFVEKFPAYQRIIPTANDKRVDVNRMSLAAALRRVLSVSGESRSVYIEFDGNSLSLSARSAEAGDALEQLAVEYDKEPVKICFNGQHLLDFLNATGDPTIGLSFKDNRTPIIVSEGESFINVVMLLSEAGQ